MDCARERIDKKRMDNRDHLVNSRLRSVSLE